MSYKFQQIDFEKKTIEDIVELLRLVFPKTKKYTKEFISWQYIDNPEGKVIGLMLMIMIF